MKKIYFLFILLFFSRSIFSQQWEWAFKTENINVASTAIADDGSTYVVGNFEDSCLFKDILIHGQPGRNTGLEVRLSVTGDIIWYKLFDNAMLKGLCVIGNYPYVCGNFEGIMSGEHHDYAADMDIFIYSCTPMGLFIGYLHDGGPGNQTIRDVCEVQGSLVIGGSFSGGAVFSGNDLGVNGPNGTFLLRYSTSLNLVFSKQIQGIGGILRLQSDDDGSIYLHGAFSDTIRFGNVDTLVYFPAWGYTSQILRFNSNGFLKSIFWNIGGYATNLINFTAHQQGTYIMELMYLSCNHCVPGTRIAKINTASQANWMYDYGPGNPYSSPPDPWIVPGDIASLGTRSLVVGYHVGGFIIDTFGLVNSGMFMAIVDDSGNFQSAENIQYDLGPTRLSGIKNGEVIVSGNFLGNAFLGNLPLQGGSEVSRFIAKYSDAQLTSTAEAVSGQHDLHLYPNPSNGHFVLKGVEFPALIQVFDVMGTEVLSNVLTQEEFDIDLPKALYLLRVRSQKDPSGFVHSAKIIIQ